MFTRFEKDILLKPKLQKNIEMKPNCDSEPYTAKSLRNQRHYGEPFLLSLKLADLKTSRRITDCVSYVN